MHDPAYIKDLFIRFMAGECSREEIDLLISHLESAGDDDLLPSVPEFRDAFPELRQIGGEASRRIQKKLDAIINEAPGTASPASAAASERPDAASRPLRPDNIPDQRESRLQPGWLRSSRWMRRVAAVLALTAVSAVFYLSYQIFMPERYDTGNAQIRNLRLDDGSSVTLNANSGLEVRMSEDLREVWLEGEAFFNVSHDSSRKFIVHTSDELSIEVLGTEFNVKNRADGAHVVLNKGSVRVKLLHGEALAGQVLMLPGEMVEHHPAGDSLYKSRVDTSKYSSWKDNLLVFEEVTLEQIALTIENQFGYTVRFVSPDLARLHFTGSNPADNLEMLLETLERSFGISITKRDKELIISK